MRLRFALVVPVLAGFAAPAHAVVYCRSPGVPVGCVVRPAVPPAAAAPGVGAPGVGAAPPASASAPAPPPTEAAPSTALVAANPRVWGHACPQRGSRGLAPWYAFR